ncbi:MAG: serine/threonine protein phosphatase [Planctomycetes bacterium]|nr:serine/threonine protein phosphatase [Planctomycetota bacterium]
MRCLAIGDVHGCLTALRTLARAVDFQAGDRLVFLGDYVDRGPDSRAVIDWILDLSNRVETITLRGNHEVMMLEAWRNPRFLSGWLGCGGLATLDSYRPHPYSPRRIEDVPPEHWAFVEATRPYYETDSHIFVHGNVDPARPLAEQSDEMLYWMKFNGDGAAVTPHCSGKTMICGHAAQRSGVPAVTPSAVCIDTWVYGDGWLTCLDAESGHIWQANQAGRTRELRLDELMPTP